MSVLDSTVLITFCLKENFLPHLLLTCFFTLLNFGAESNLDLH